MLRSPNANFNVTDSNIDIHNESEGMSPSSNVCMNLIKFPDCKSKFKASKIQ